MKPRNPIAKAVTRVRPQVVPDRRRKILDDQRERAAKESLDYDNDQQEGCGPESEVK